MTITDDKTRQISTTEAADIYGFSRRYLTELARKGRLKAKRVGKSWVITPLDVEDYIRSRQKSGGYRGDIHLED